METCDNVYRRKVIQPESTAKVAKMGCWVYEISILSSVRAYAERKRSTWEYRAPALWSIVKYGVLPNRPLTDDAASAKRLA
jgi:hypothetical protein